jgi:hypothetical protein
MSVCVSVPYGRRFGESEEEPIIRSSFPAKYLSTLELSLDIQASMSPSFSLLVFYIRDDTETITDSMEYTVEPCFDNKVTFL